MLSTELVNEKLASIKSLKVEVSSVTPSSQRLGGIVGCLWVYMQKMELRYWREYGDEKTRMN